MFKRIMSLCIILAGLIIVSNIFAKDDKKESAVKDSTKTETKKTPEKKKKKPKEPKFEELIEDYQKIDGFFTLYQNKNEGKTYLEIRQDQFDTVFLCNITRQAGDASIFDGAAMLGEFPFYIKKVGKKVQFIQKNVAFRAGGNPAAQRAIKNNLSNSIWSSAKIASQPHPEIGSILIDANNIFLKDFAGVSSALSRAKLSYSFDKDNSSIAEIKSFPFNTEIDIKLHFKSSKGRPIFTLPDSRSMFHRYHYSISMLPESNYQPRMADDRVGHFLTMYQDYASVLDENPYKRYISRWNLQKSEPKFAKSKPKQPIVYWLENTIPVEYRDAIRKGILLWNDAFEKIGFTEAIVVKEMPDDADWDPADVRYNTIRWIIQPGGAYAVGPSRANPFTGEIYDADIRISADMVRVTYKEFDQFIEPNSWEKLISEPLLPMFKEPGLDGERHLHGHRCNFADGALHQMQLGLSVLHARGELRNDPLALENYIKEFLTHVIAHEVGHTLGLRHNFKASTVNTVDELTNKNYTMKKGLTGSVMDYTPVNLAPPGEQQGQYYQTTLGAYDYWAIEYAYSPYDPDSKQSEKEMLEKIANRVAKPELIYGTDEDAFGYSTRSIDPTCNLWDIGSEPLDFFEGRIAIAKELWKNIPEKFDEKGERYQKFRLAFGQGVSEYAIASNTVPKYIGGIYHYRDHIGDPNGRKPFKVVAPEKQRRALKFITQNYFAPDAFQFSPDLLNKLAPERFWDFEGRFWRISRLDYPIHGIVQLMQASAMFKLFDPYILLRVQDNELKYEGEKNPFRMPELFEQVRTSVWEELETGDNINSFRRELQRIHLYVLNRLVVFSPKFLPHDAISLARFDLKIIQSKIKKAMQISELDTYSKAHLEELDAKISATLKAQIEGAF